MSEQNKGLTICVNDGRGDELRSAGGKSYFMERKGRIFKPSSPN